MSLARSSIKSIHTYTDIFGINNNKDIIVYNEIDGNLFFIPMKSISTDNLNSIAKINIGNKTGDMIDYLGSDVPFGWIAMNNTSIGSPTSGATQRANEDCHKLFVQLWNAYPNSVFPISGGRGSNAESDWNANKRMTILLVQGTILNGSYRSIKILKL